MSVRGPDPITREHLETLVEKCPVTGCWMLIDRDQFFTYNGRKFPTAVYEALKGPIPLESGRFRRGRQVHMSVRHTCDNRACVCPDHLILGTHADNIRDIWNQVRAGIRMHPSPSKRAANNPQQDAVYMRMRLFGSCSLDIKSCIGRIVVGKDEFESKFFGDYEALQQWLKEGCPMLGWNTPKIESKLGEWVPVASDKQKLSLQTAGNIEV